MFLLRRLALCQRANVDFISLNLAPELLLVVPRAHDLIKWLSKFLVKHLTSRISKVPSIPKSMFNTYIFF